VKPKTDMGFPMVKGALVEKSPSIFKGKLKSNQTATVPQVNGDMTSLIGSSRNSLVAN